MTRAKSSSEARTVVVAYDDWSMDDPNMRWDIEDRFESLGYTVVTAATCQDLWMATHCRPKPVAIVMGDRLLFDKMVADVAREHLPRHEVLRGDDLYAYMFTCREFWLTAPEHVQLKYWDWLLKHTPYIRSLLSRHACVLTTVDDDLPPVFNKYRHWLAGEGLPYGRVRHLEQWDFPHRNLDLDALVELVTRLTEHYGPEAGESVPPRAA